MILGIGIDIVEIEKFESLLKKSGERLLNKFAHPIEKKLSPKVQNQRYYEYWAARFAVREAFAKAIGTGLGSGFESTEIGVAKNPKGKPFLKIEKKLLERLNKQGMQSFHVSIAHSFDFALAMVVIEGSDRRKKVKQEG
jgi:holo-[acyl-carrier protein] synthase